MFDNAARGLWAFCGIVVLWPIFQKKVRKTKSTREIKKRTKHIATFGPINSRKKEINMSLVKSFAKGLGWLMVASWVAIGISKCAGCKESTAASPQLAKTRPCACAFIPLGYRGNNYYVSVSGFDPKEKDCYLFLREFAKSQTTSLSPPITLHVLDNLPNFAPPQDGVFYGTEQVRKQVILQYVKMRGDKEEYFFDPFGYGRYQEVK